MRYSFQPSRAIQESFQCDYPEAIISELFIPASSSRSPNLTGASFKYSLVSSQSLHSLVSKFLSSIFVHFLILSVELCLCYFHFQFLRWFVQDSFFLCPHINLFVVSILPVFRWRSSQVCAISILILSTRISSMPNPLIVINLIGEG